MVLKCCFYVGVSLCSLCESNILGVRAIFLYGCLPHLSSMCAGYSPLDRGCCCCDDQSLHWLLSGDSSLLCGCHSPVGSRVSSTVVGIDASRSISELWCEVGGTGVLLLGEEPLSIILQELPSEKCTVWCCLSPIAQIHKAHCFGHHPWLHLNCGYSNNRPGCSSGAVLTKPLEQICWCRTAEVRRGTAVVLHLDLP